MRDEYNIAELNPRKNPYAKKLSKDKKPITINVNVSTIDYFKDMAEESGIPYQIIMNAYLDDCVKQRKKIAFV